MRGGICCCLFVKTQQSLSLTLFTKLNCHFHAVKYLQYLFLPTQFIVCQFRVCPYLHITGTPTYHLAVQFTPAFSKALIAHLRSPHLYHIEYRIFLLLVSAIRRIASHVLWPTDYIDEVAQEPSSIITSPNTLSFTEPIAVCKIRNQVLRYR